MARVRPQGWSGVAARRLAGRDDVRMDPTLAAVVSRAKQQDGCITTAECLEIGLSRKRVGWLVRQVHWRRLHRGVYVTSSGEPMWRQRARAALLYAGPDAALSHDAAGYVRGLVDRAPRIIEVSIPESRRVRPSRGLRIVLRTPMPPSSGRLRTVSPEHTVVDLVARARTVDDAVGVITRAYRKGIAPWAIREALVSRSRLRRRDLVTDLLAEADAGIESPLERRYHHDVERAHGLPRATLQARTVLGGRATRADRLYDAFGLRVELDGQLAHPGGRTDRDVWRDNAATVERSELTLRYRWIHVVSMACETAAQVARALRRNGWTGTPRPCGPHCRVAAHLSS